MGEYIIFFSISYMLNSRNRACKPYFLNVKILFADSSRAEPTTCTREKISFSLKLFSGHFDRQSIMKSLRGPLDLS